MHQYYINSDAQVTWVIKDNILSFHLEATVPLTVLVADRWLGASGDI